MKTSKFAGLSADEWHAPVTSEKFLNMDGVQCILGPSPQSASCQIGGLLANALVCEITLALGLSGMQLLCRMHISVSLHCTHMCLWSQFTACFQA